MKHNFRLTPGTVVFVSALAVIVLSRVIPFVFGQRISTVDPRVSIENTVAARSTSERPKYRPSTAAMSGEVARTEERMREATALAVAASLYMVKERTQGRVARTVNDLLAGVVQANLLPPGLALNDLSGTLLSEHGMFFVRYRPTPLGVEVVSLGRGRAAGPGLIVRVPDDGAGKDGASVYVATKLEMPVIPQAFAPTSEVIATGWSPEPLRAIQLPTSEQAQLRAWEAARQAVARQ